MKKGLAKKNASCAWDTKPLFITEPKYFCPTSPCPDPCTASLGHGKMPLQHMDSAARSSTNCGLTNFWVQVSFSSDISEPGRNESKDSRPHGKGIHYYLPRHRTHRRLHLPP